MTLRWALAAAAVAAWHVGTPTVRVRLERAAGATPRASVFRIHVEGTDLQLGSYQGALTWDPAVVTVDSVVAGKDGFRLVNGNDRGKGRLRFSGFTPTGFKTTEAAVVFAHGKTAPMVGQLVATLEVAGDLEGHAVAKSGLVGSKTVR